MRRLPENVFDKPWLLLCEGEADKKFFDHLIQARNIDDRFYVHFPDRKGDTGGRSRFGNWLDTVHKTSESFRSKVEAILVVSDNDTDPATSFAEVQAELKKAGGYGVPNAEQIVARKRDYPDVVVLMIPIGVPGNLETLCLAAAYDKWPLQQHVETFVNNTPAKDWTVGKQSKTRLHAILAATCETKPDTSFAHHWQEREEFHIPLAHDSFNGVADFLKNFNSLLADEQVS